MIHVGARGTFASVAVAAMLATLGCAGAGAQGAGAKHPSLKVAQPFETRYAQVATKTGVHLTYAKELRCVARELARFRLEHDAYPDERLKRFIIASCGLTTANVSYAEQRRRVPRRCSRS